MDGSDGYPNRPPARLSGPLVLTCGLMNSFSRFALVGGVSLALAGGTLAQTASPTPAPPAKPTGQTVRVATREVAPFVMRKDGQLTGFSVELWSAIAAKLGTNTQWDVQRDAPAIVAGVQSGRDQIGIAALSITAKREQVVDFSQPMFDSGLQILTRGQSAQPSLLSGLGQLVRSPLMVQFGWAIALLTIVPSHVLWFIERRKEEGIIRSKKYFPGIFEAVWWTVTCLATQAEEMPRSTFGRVMAVIWMFFAILFTAYVTGTLTASLTVQSLHGDIKGPDDLPGRAVATVAGSTAQDYLADHKVKATPFPGVDAAFKALEAKQVEAFVYDAPVLQYVANTDGKGETQLVGPVFLPEKYGIAFGNNSPWRKRVNLALLQLREDGTYDALHAKYFGDAPG